MCLSVIAASCNTCDALSFSKSISTVLMMTQDAGERMTEWCSRHDAWIHHASRATPGWEGRVHRGGFGTRPYEMPGWGCGDHSHLTSGKMPGMKRAPINPPFCHLCITHMSHCVRPGCTRSLWRGLPQPACRHHRHRRQVLVPLADWNPAPRSDTLATAATTATIRCPSVTCDPRDSDATR
ncbi:MAG: hypothetical protein KatS3mg056_1269 [Chloroflexus sp.]|jgi:hypothetical protein|nr:MAG: hypothetical protein KatS3mg056_1269 [Chloroflexus sp.]